MGITAFLEEARNAIRVRHFSLRTEEVYLHRIKEFIYYHGKRNPATFGALEVQQYLTYLAVEKNVAASTQNVARSAVLFLYRDVLRIPLEPLSGIAPARRPERLPVVFTPQEVKLLLAHLSGTHLLMASLLYGSGLRLMECLRLRVKDVDLALHQITIRDGKGAKDRVTMLPRTLDNSLRAQLAAASEEYQKALAESCADVFLPDALSRKYPNAAQEWAWQWVFPAGSLSSDPRTGQVRRHHASEDSLQRAVKTAIQKAGIAKHGSCHTLRHSFATHVLNRSGKGVRSPLDER